MNPADSPVVDVPGIAPCLAVVIPVFNEAATIASVVKIVAAQPLVREIIIVDDGSVDGTWNALEPVARAEPRAKLFRHSVNQGKGAALRTGFAQVTAPLAIVQDADLEYDPTEYGVLCKPILAGKADVVFGSRFLGAGAHRVLVFLALCGQQNS
jgi:glycosyltransferase involved in cell wall biosynthesis